MEIPVTAPTITPEGLRIPAVMEACPRISAPMILIALPKRSLYIIDSLKHPSKSDQTFVAIYCLMQL